MQDNVMKIIKVSIAISWIMLVALLIPVLLLLGFGGIEVGEYFQKYSFYVSVGIGCCVFMIAITAIVIATKNKHGEIFIHSPFQSPALLSLFGEKIKDKLKWLLSPAKMIVYFVVIWSIAGIIGSFLNTFWVPTPAIQMQVAEITKAYFPVEPASTVETILAICVIFIFLSIFKFLIRNMKDEKTKIMVYVVIAMLIGSVIGGVYWGLFHQARYGGIEKAELKTFAFGTIGGGITVVSGSIIPWLTWHIVNNFYNYLNESEEKGGLALADDVILVYSVVFLSIFIILSYLLLFRKRKKNVKGI